MHLHGFTDLLQSHRAVSSTAVVHWQSRARSYNAGHHLSFTRGCYSIVSAVISTIPVLIPPSPLVQDRGASRPDPAWTPSRASRAAGSYRWWSLTGWSHRLSNCSSASYSRTRDAQVALLSLAVILALVTLLPHLSHLGSSRKAANERCSTALSDFLPLQQSSL